MTVELAGRTSRVADRDLLYILSASSAVGGEPEHHHQPHNKIAWTQLTVLLGPSAGHLWQGTDLLYVKLRRVKS